MTRFLADEGFNNDVLHGLQRRVAHLDPYERKMSGCAGQATAKCSGALPPRTASC
jgi:hypothetical protein